MTQAQVTRRGNRTHRSEVQEQSTGIQWRPGRRQTCSNCSIDWPTSESMRLSCSSWLSSLMGCLKSVSDSLRMLYSSRAVWAAGTRPCDSRQGTHQCCFCDDDKHERLVLQQCSDMTPHWLCASNVWTLYTAGRQEALCRIYPMKSQLT